MQISQQMKQKIAEVIFSGPFTSSFITELNRWELKQCSSFFLISVHAESPAGNI